MQKAIFRRSILALAISASFSGIATAQNGSWNVNADGFWSNTPNWSGGIPANGSGFTATFANNITGDRTVTLDGPRTLTNLIFGDANTSTAGDWTIAGPNVLTLSGTTPTITVNTLGTGKSVQISTTLAGTAGLTKEGSGLLKLSGSLSGLTGPIAINSGTLQFANDAATGIGVASNLTGSGTVIFTGANTGVPTGSASSFFITGSNTSFSGTMVADNASLVITRTSDVGTATLTNTENGQFNFILGGAYTNNFEIQGLGWGGDEGNTGVIRLGHGTLLSGQITMAGDARITAPGVSSSAIPILSGPLGETGGARTLEFGGATSASLVTLAGANTYTGGTIINGTNGITGAGLTTSLTLDYSSQDNSKLGDSGNLKFKGISNLILVGGSHAEIVGSTTLDPGANASIDGGPSTLNLGPLTRNPVSTLTIGSAAIVTTTSGTVGEAFGSWFVVGNDLAARNSGNQIVPVNNTDVPTVTGTIVDGPSTSIRLTTNTAGAVALGGNTGDTITINTLSRHVDELATINTAGKTLRIQKGILSNNGSGGITIGTDVDSGIVTAGSANNSAGTLDVNAIVGSVTINSRITDNGTGPVTVTLLSSGGTGSNLSLRGTNSYTGGTILNGIATLAIGNNAALGTGPVTLLASATLGPATSSQAPIALSNNIAINNASTLTLALDNTKFTLNGVLTGATGKLIVRGSLDSSLTLTKTSTYAGSTTVSSGKLLLGNGGNLASSALIVANGASFGISQNANSTTNATTGEILLLSGSSFSMADGFTSTFNVGNGATLTGGANSTLSFDFNSATATTDRLAITGNVTGTGGTTIAINPVGSAAPTTGSYTIITAAFGLNTANFTLPKAKVVFNGTAYGINLTNTATTSTLNVTGFTGLDAVYWKGDQDGAWNANNSGNTNWSLAADGVTDPGALPNGLTDIFFNAAGATNLTTTLGADFTIQSLNYTATSGATSLAAGNTLTIGISGANSPGINVASGSAAQTINAPIVLAAAQSWTNNSTNTLTIGGTVTIGGFGLTLAGTGPTTINGAIAGTGTLTINSPGNVIINGDITGGMAITATGTGTAALYGNISGTSILTKTGTGTLTVSGTNSYTGGTSLSGGGTLKVTSSGGLGTAGQKVSVSAATLLLASDTPVSSKHLTVSSDMTVILDRQTAGAGLTTIFGDLTHIATGRTMTVSNGANVTSGTSTLEFNGILRLTGTPSVFAIGEGAAVNLSGGTPAASQTITLTKQGAGTLIFSGNTESWNSGNFALNGGTLELRTRMGDNTQFAAPISTAPGTTVRLVGDAETPFISNLTVSRGNVQVVADRLTSAATSTTHSLGNLTLSDQMLTVSRGSNITDAGVAGVTFNENINSTTGTTTLTLNARFNTEANTLLTIKGVTSGTGSLTKLGPGSMTLAAANTYSGGTIISAGTLALANAGNLGTGDVVVNGTLSVIGITPASYTFLATQTVSGSGTILATGKSVSIPGILSPGNSPGTLNVAGNLALTSTTDSLFEITGQNPSDVDLLNVSGNLTYGGELFIANNQAAGSFNLFDFAALTPASDFSSISLTGLYTGSLTPSGLNDNQWSGTVGIASVTFNGTTGVLNINVIPEPSTLVLGAFGLLGFGLLRLRRRKTA